MIADGGDQLLSGSADDPAVVLSVVSTNDLAVPVVLIAIRVLCGAVGFVEQRWSPEVFLREGNKRLRVASLGRADLVAGLHPYNHVLPPATVTQFSSTLHLEQGGEDALAAVDDVDDESTVSRDLYDAAHHGRDHDGSLCRIEFSSEAVGTPFGKRELDVVAGTLPILRDLRRKPDGL